MAEEEPKHSIDWRLVMALTVSRLGFAVVIAFLLPGRAEEVWATWLGLACLLLIEATDAMDGYCARRFHVVSDLGKMLDPYADSVSRILVFWTLARYDVRRCWEVVPLAMVVRDITVAYARIALSMSGKSVAARWTGKVKAVVQGFAGGFLIGGPIWWGWAGHLRSVSLFGQEVTLKTIGVHGFSAAVVLVVLVSMIDYVKAAAQAWNEKEDAAAQEDEA